MTDGQKTLAAIETSIADLQKQERDLQAKLERSNAERTELVERRLKAIRELAEVRTRNALADGVIDHSDRLSEQVAGLLDARTKTVAALKTRHGDATRDRRERMASQAERNKKVETLEAQLDETASQVRQDAAASPDYSAAVDRKDEAKATLDRAAAKARQAHEDRDDKGRPYESDPLFMYLWKRNYGQEGYEANSVIRWLDDWVARLVRYHDARANYHVLLQIPERLDTHVARLAENVRTAQSDVDKLEADLIRQAAGSDLIGALETERGLYQSENAAIAKLADEIADVSGQLNYYAEGRDHAFRQAVEMTAHFLEDESLSRLRMQARSTPTPSDDQIVDRIADIDDAIDRLREQADDSRVALEGLFKKKSELMRIATEFRRQQYDDTGSIFVPEGTGEVILRELLRGAIGAAEYWARTRSSHRWRSRPGDSYRRQSRSWPMGGSASDWDFDWGSSSRGGDHDPWGDEDFYTDESF